MNLILKIFLMEKDILNQKTLLKIIKCLILDSKYIYIYIYNLYILFSFITKKIIINIII